MPLPLLVKPTPVGSAPVWPIVVGTGNPLVVTVKVFAWPTVKVAALALVIVGGWFTVRVKGWPAGAPTPFVAVNVNAYAPPVAAAEVPLRVPVPLPLSTYVTRFGRAARALRVIAGVGNPVAVIVNEPGTPTANETALALVMAGAWFTVRMKAWAAVVPTTFWAVKLIA